MEKKEGMESSVKVTLIVCATLVFISLLGIYAFNRIIPASNTIRTEGMAEIKAVPDIVGIYFNIETNGLTAKEAKDKNSEIVDAVINSLINFGFERDRITTQNFNIYEDYEYDDGKRISNGYKTTHSLKVELKTEDTEKSGEVIDIGIDSGATISYINFELSLDKQNKYKALALSQATEDARIKAEAISDGLNKNLGKLVSIYDSSFDYYPWRTYESVGIASIDIADAKSATSIQPGEQTISARITAVYRI